MQEARGFTLVEVGVVTLVLSVGAAVALPQLQEGQEVGRRLKDATHLRGVLQACAVWGQNNRDLFPIPSNVDRNGAALPRPDGLQGQDLRLDTTGNVLSLLIFNGFIPVELTVSPVENGNVEVMEKYEYVNPAAAADPTTALWDPAYRGTALDEWGGKVPGKAGDKSHNSYASTLFHGARRARWSNTFSAVEAVWGNRGPAYTLEADRWVLLADNPLGDGSTTLGFHGAQDAWAGNVVFNDHHVEFLEAPDPESVTWTFVELEGAPDRARPDNLFHAEHDRTRAPIGEHLEIVAGKDGRGIAKASGEKPGDGALDQRNNYLRPVSAVSTNANGVAEVRFWID